MTAVNCSVLSPATIVREVLFRVTLSTKIGLPVTYAYFAPL